jgi:TRAP-type C4-dicarboxylate transport system permease large subunit
MFMDIISATLILGPVFLPMLHAFNVDPMHFGLILTVNLAIGYCTPPMGVSLFIAGSIANRDLVYGRGWYYASQGDGFHKVVPP